MIFKLLCNNFNTNTLGDSSGHGRRYGHQNGSYDHVIKITSHLFTCITQGANMSTFLTLLPPHKHHCLGRRMKYLSSFGSSERLAASVLPSFTGNSHLATTTATDCSEGYTIRLDGIPDCSFCPHLVSTIAGYYKNDLKVIF